MKQSIRNIKLKILKDSLDSYDPLENSGNIIFDNSSDLDLYFYNRDTPYILLKELQNFLGDDKDENVSILHLNIRKIKRKF